MEAARRGWAMSEGVEDKDLNKVTVARTTEKEVKSCTLGNGLIFQESRQKQGVRY